MRVGVSATTVNRWENGVQRPQLAQVERLCSVFAAPPSELGLEAVDAEGQSGAVIVSAKPPGAAALRSVPDLDGELVVTAAHDAVRARLLGAGGPSGRPRVLALRGPGGFGKTSLAKQLCHDPSVRGAFGDGQVWVETGPDCPPARVVQLAADVCVQLGITRPDVVDPDQAGYVLAQAIGPRHLLLVVDDVWSARDLRPFLTGGPNCTRLVTTQHARVCPASAVEHPVGPMPETELERLFASMLPGANVGRLARLCGGWPLLARVVGASVRRDIDAGAAPARAIAAAAHELRSCGPCAFDVWDGDQRTNAVGRIVQLGIERLGAHVRIGPHRDLHERFLSLAVFPSGCGIPLRVLTGWWSRAHGWTDAEVRRFCHELLDRSLIAGYDAGAGTIALYDVFRTCMRSALGDRIDEITRSLLDSLPDEPG